VNQPINFKQDSYSAPYPRSESGTRKDSRSSAPSVSILKGSGAVHPKLTLACHCRAGNGPVAFGWSLSLPPVTPNAPKGLSKSRDISADRFILSDCEDLETSAKLRAEAKWPVRKYKREDFVKLKFSKTLTEPVSAIKKTEARQLCHGYPVRKNCDSWKQFRSVETQNLPAQSGDDRQPRAHYRRDRNW
jgi:hypothetical protein